MCLTAHLMRPNTPCRTRQEPIRRSLHATASAVEHIGGQHRRTGILVHEKLEPSAPPTIE
jgi:hypothetical protein